MYGVRTTMREQSGEVSNNQGFTLIELAIVLVIVGILVGAGASMVGVLSTAVKVRETKDLLDANMQAVASWASSHNSIPDAAGFTGAAKSPQDSWGRDFIYLYDANLNAATPTKDTICGRRSTTLTVHTTDPVATINNIAFVVFSPSDDAAVQATLTATVAPAVAATFNGAASGPAILPGARGFATGTVNIDATNSDIVRWVTLDELRSKVGCQGAPLKIVNNELPYGQAPNVYAATITADGGVPFATGYKWCVNSPLPAGFVTPPAGGIVNADCLSTTESTWGATAAASALTISFPAAAVAAGSYQITVVARDNADGVTTSAACNASPGDNCAQKVFVITVNPF